ncbi:MAG TPA: DinB family protein [Trueperaceae bacterium]|nr:DinB family protein [Trueperaceae bacterium]
MSVPVELKLILEAFDRNARVNRATLGTLTMEDLNHSDGAGGFSVGQHLADIVDFRPGWLSRVSPAHAEGIPDVTGDTPTWLTVSSIEELQRAFDAGDAAVKEAVISAVNEGRSFEGAYPSHPAHFLQHTIVHDSHHRGQILALLRQAGRPAEVREELEGASWAIWRE